MAAQAASTIPRIFETAVRQGGDRPAMGFFRDGQLHWRTWPELAADVQQQAAAMVAAGIQPGDRVAHVSENRYEWIVTDLAIHQVGAVHVPIHVTLSGQQIAEQIALTEARLVFVSDDELLSKFADGLSERVKVVGHTPPSIPPHQGEGNLVPDSPAPRLQSPAPNSLASILFTSGTTGQPRGVMLSQQNLVANAATMARMMPPEGDELRLCMLPLSHIYARTCDLYLWLCRGTRLVLAESKETVLRDCQLAQPTSIRAVPYFYQKLAERIRGAGGNSTALRKVLGGRIRHCFCGGAGLDESTANWFNAQGLPIYCGYGLTEASPVVTASLPGAHRQDAVGKPLDGVEVRLAHDGEIMVRGPNVMLGYWQDESATREAIRDGWLQTGDLGRWDDGFLAIDGRKKELIVISTGKKVSPARVEAQLLASPWIAQAMVVGDGRSHLGAVIVPKSEAFKDAEPAEIHRTIAREICERLADSSREERIRVFTLLDRPFSADRGELTAKGGLCRPKILANFSAEIDEMFRPATRPDVAGVAS